MYDITPIIEILFALAGAVILVFLVPFIKRHTDIAKQESINTWVKIAVTAAEQIFSGTGKGQDKKAYVLSFLNSKGITFDETSLNAMIEAAVFDLKSGFITIGG